MLRINDSGSQNKCIFLIGYILVYTLSYIWKQFHSEVFKCPIVSNQKSLMCSINPEV